MVNKLWYDWQHCNKRNAKRFFGGSVPAVQSIEAYDQYPSGAPPLLNVSLSLLKF